MAEFRVSSVGETYTYIYVSPSTAYNWYRVYVRLDDGSNMAVYDVFHELYEGSYIRVGDLTPGTNYAVNVSYGTAPDANYTAGWFGLQTFTTNGTNPGGGGGTETTTRYVTFNFDANGGSGAPAAVTFADTVTGEYVRGTLPSKEPTRNGYTFVGWCFDSDGSSTVYPAGWTDQWWASPYSSYSATLYAVWVKKATGDGGVWIGTGYGFVKATPYICLGGTTWVKATPYICQGGTTWKKGV